MLGMMKMGYVMIVHEKILRTIDTIRGSFVWDIHRRRYAMFGLMDDMIV
jgi:hypothetical protein